MVRRILVTAMAVTMTIPTVTYADVNLSGLIQAEMGSAQIGRDENNQKVDRLRVTKDSSGTVHNGGVNKIEIEVDEKLDNGLTAIALYQAGFNTAGNAGLNSGKESWLGLKGESISFKFGTISSAYKSLKNHIDPYSGTAIQARGSAGGMSGSAYNAVQALAVPIIGKDGKPHYVASKTLAGKVQSHYALTHNGFAKNMLEISGDFGGLSAVFQGFFDETSNLDSGGSMSLAYKMSSFTLYGGASYVKLKEVESTGSNKETDAESTPASSHLTESDNATNWKLGVQYKMQGFSAALQYEEADFGMLDGGIEGVLLPNDIKVGGNANGGEYIIGSAEFDIPNTSWRVGGWVSGYISGIEDEDKLVDSKGNLIEEDAISFALGAKYLISKRTFFYGGYLNVDSDNNYRDENLFGVGMRHAF